MELIAAPVSPAELDGMTPLVAQLGCVLGAVLLLRVAPAATRVRIRIKRGRRTLASGRLATAGAASALGLLLVPNPLALADERAPVSPARRGSLRLPPWDVVSGLLPPRPLTRPGAPGRETTGEHRIHAGPGRSWVIPRVVEMTSDRTTAVHEAAPVVDSPSAHSASSSPLSLPSTNAPLPYASAAGQDEGAVSLKDRAARKAAMARHPAGKSGVCRYVVVEGDTLWGIAERVLGPVTSARIARYWPRIHRANRDVIGVDPNFIEPGQVLRLPAECE